ncbi:MAG: aminotransferase class I/II-fold pyridoxal phosphate-dependent enzyme [Lachnospiraceae bacterium]|nr:aminotransferase class I/II-fold pyridoxal phosphate-dependent enzyme [Lachnospiraceae bacterium]
MKYDFDKIIDRRGKDATAIDGIGKKVWGVSPDSAKSGFSEIPMWVADMNFETSPSITRALEERIRHPLYGYFLPSERYYDSIIRWQTRLHGYEGLTPEVIGYENGVHGCIMTSIATLTEPGEAVFLHSPAYLGFLADLKSSGREAVVSPLKKDENGVWRMDFEDMEKKLKSHNIRLAIFCSPHNPSGRVWERWELDRAMELFRDNDCTVISDEIWSDIVFEGKKHIPTSMVSEDAKNRTISLYAPSKTFNLAGLIGSYHIIFNPLLRERIRRHGERTQYNEMNVLSMHALIGAYEDEGYEWLGELLKVLERNCRYAVNYINENFEGCSVSMPEATYMLFMDCSGFLKERGITLDDLLKAGWDIGVKYQDGRAFAWQDAVRINAALPESLLKEAFDRLSKYVFS